MSTVSEVADAIVVALRTVPNLRVSLDAGGAVSPPQAVVGPPRLVWEGYCDGPTSGTFRVALVVANTDHAMERLWDLLPAVAEAIDSVPAAAVTRADPGSFTSGGADLPAYDLTIEVSL
jgi:hypothetical protein